MDASTVVHPAAEAPLGGLALVNPTYDAAAMPLASQEKYGRVFSSRLDKPDRVYYRICSVLESLLKVAAYHNIQMWADYGTLLGLKRERGVILWDYDADLGMFQADRERLLAAVKLEQERGSITPDLIMDEAYYNDVGCMAAYLKGDEKGKENICDIIFNVIENGVVKSLQTQAVLDEYPCAYNYMGKVEDVLPLKPDILLGHRVWTWNNWEMPLNLTYGDWRTPLKSVSSWIVDRFHVKCVAPLPEHQAPDFKTLMALRDSHKVPFIARQTPLLSCDLDRYQDIISKQKTDVFGYKSSIVWDKNHATPTETFNMFLNHKLPYNIVDSPIDDWSILPPEWASLCTDNMTVDAKEGTLCFVMTEAPCVSFWHTDPVFNDPAKHKNNPGGWMKLLYGRKIWWMIPAEDFAILEAKGHTVESVAKLTLSQVLELEDGAMWGKILIGEISGGDFLWFPPGCLHKVFTLESSLGFGGYL